MLASLLPVLFDWCCFSRIIILILMEKCVGYNRPRTALLLTLSELVSQNQGQIWSNVHVGTAILCASLPTFPPLLSHFLAFCNKTALRLSSLFVDLCTFRETDSQESWDDNNSNPHHQLNNSAGDKRLFMEAAAIESGSWSTESGTEMSGIVVRDIINVE